MNDHLELSSKYNIANGYPDLVASDSDLLTFLEFKELGYTTVERVSHTREDLISECDIEQLRFEIGRDYSIDRESVLHAERLCLVAIRHKVESFLNV